MQKSRPWSKPTSGTLPVSTAMQFQPMDNHCERSRVRSIPNHQTKPTSRPLTSCWNSWHTMSTEQCQPNRAFNHTLEVFEISYRQRSNVQFPVSSRRCIIPPVKPPNNEGSHLVIASTVSWSSLCLIFKCLRRLYMIAYGCWHNGQVVFPMCSFMCLPRLVR